MKLSEEQELAVAAPEKRVIVIAGPGAGKSRVLVERAKRSNDRENTVVISFTNAAADELIERLEADGIYPYAFRHIGTLHSWAIKELYKGDCPKVCGDKEKEEAIDEVIKTFGAPARNLTRSDIWDAATNTPAFGNLRSIGKAIRAHFRKQNMTHVDFLLSDFLEIAGNVIVPAEIMVDETQDSGELDMEIYHTFHQLGATLFTVADPRQSCYGFRGAAPWIVTRETKEIRPYLLKTNYRSEAQICRLATDLAKQMHGLDHFDTSIVPATTEKMHGLMGVMESDTAEEEALAITKWIPEEGTCAVLCRYRDQAQSVASILRAKGINLTASTDNELSTEAASWLPRIIEASDFLTPPTMNTSDWEKVLCKIGVPLAEQASLLPRLLRCNSTADIASMETDEFTRDECLVFVGTIHSAKGREFDSVWVLGCDDATFHPNDQETLRLLFVAATRARHTLVLSYAKSRQQPGSGKRITVNPSTYLKLL